MESIVALVVAGAVAVWFPERWLLVSLVAVFLVVGRPVTTVHHVETAEPCEDNGRWFNTTFCYRPHMLVQIYRYPFNSSRWNVSDCEMVRSCGYLVVRTSNKTYTSDQ